MSDETAPDQAKTDETKQNSSLDGADLLMVGVDVVANVVPSKASNVGAVPRIVGAAANDPAGGAGAAAEGTGSDLSDVAGGIGDAVADVASGVGDAVAGLFDAL